MHFSFSGSAPGPSAVSLPRLLPVVRSGRRPRDHCASTCRHCLRFPNRSVRIQRQARQIEILPGHLGRIVSQTNPGRVDTKAVAASARDRSRQSVDDRCGCRARSISHPVPARSSANGSRSFSRAAMLSRRQWGRPHKADAPLSLNSPSPSRSPADPAMTAACRTASATNRPDERWRWRGWCACRCHIAAICRACA
jgi:hypothetical protein